MCVCVKKNDDQVIFKTNTGIDLPERLGPANLQTIHKFYRGLTWLLLAH